MTSRDVIAMRYSLARGTFRMDAGAELPMHGITGVFGRSGAGKTTLLRCIAGLERKAAGELVVAGERWQGGGASRPAHERPVGYVFQEPRLFDHLSVRGNIEYGRRRRAGVADDDLAAVVELLGLEPLLARRPVELSGGEAQRVAIARALASAPRIVLMDEPLASLDRARKDEILPFLDRLHGRSKVPIVYVSHSIEEICRLCDHLLVMEAGRIVAEGALQDVLMQTELAVLGGAEAGSVVEARVECYDADDGLLQLQTSAGTMWIPGASAAPGSELRLRIRANDVSLCRSRAPDSTILNVVPAVIDAFQAREDGAVLVKLSAGTAKLLARVTRRSVRELALAEGDKVYAQIKSVAVRPPRPR